MTTKLASEIEQLVAERDAALSAKRLLDVQVSKQKGAIEEGRATVRQLILRNEKLAAQNARYEKHFRDALGSGESLVKHARDLVPDSSSPFNIISNEPASPSLAGRLRSIVKRGEAA